MALFATARALDRLHDVMRDLTIKVEDLERASRNLSLEYTELYDKVSRQMGRMAKRYAVDVKEAGDQLPLEQPEDEGPQVDEVTQRILNRRARGLIK